MTRIALLFLFSGCLAPLASLTARRTFDIGPQPLIVASVPDAGTEVEHVGQLLTQAIPVATRWGTLDQVPTVFLMPDHLSLEIAARHINYPWLRAWTRYDTIMLQTPSTWSASDADVLELLTHELVHTVTFQKSASPLDWTTKQIPFWFREGLATVTARQGARFPSLEDLATFAQKNPDLDVFIDGERLSRDYFEQMYGLAFHATRFLLKRYGEDFVPAAFKAMREGATFPEAFTAVTHSGVELFQADFMNYLRLRGFRGAGLPMFRHPTRLRELPEQKANPETSAP